jgi:hypothetical protein
MVKMLVIKFNAAETGHARSFQNACLAFVFQHHAVQLNTHKWSLDDISVDAENTVTPHVSTSLNYA